MMPSNKRFANRFTRSVQEIRSPHICARPSQARAVRKRSDFVFPSTDRVTQLVNRYYHSFSEPNVCFGTVANGTLPGRKYICSPLKSKVSILGFP